MYKGQRPGNSYIVISVRLKHRAVKEYEVGKAGFSLTLKAFFA